MALSADSNRADVYGTDIEIFSWPDGSVWADTRSDLPDSARHVLGLYGFVRSTQFYLADSYELLDVPARTDLRIHISWAAETLADSGLTVNVEPELYTEKVLPPYLAEARRQHAAAPTSPAAEHATRTTTAATPPPPPGPAPSTIHCTR